MDVVARSAFVVGVGLTSKTVFDVLMQDFGVEAVSSVVARNDGVYVTFFSTRDAAEFRRLGLESSGTLYPVERIDEKSIIASIFHVPEFVSDGAIEQKLLDLGCVLKGQFLWQRDRGVYFGERRVRVVLPKGVSALPSLLKVPDILGREFVLRIRHDAQTKVCNSCLASDHLYRECPRLLCRRCGEPGHLSRFCHNLMLSKDVSSGMVESTPPVMEVCNETPPTTKEITDAVMESTDVSATLVSVLPVEVNDKKRPLDPAEEANIDLLIYEEGWNEGNHTIFGQLHRHLQRKLTESEKVLAQRTRKKLETAHISKFFDGR